MVKLRPFHTVIVLISIAVATASWIAKAPSAEAQSLDALTITTCRIDQSLHRVEVAQQLGGTMTIVSGEAVVSSGFPLSRVVVVGVDNLGFQRQSQGTVARGYAGVHFRAVVPIGKVFLKGVTICLD